MNRLLAHGLKLLGRFCQPDVLSYTPFSEVHHAKVGKRCTLPPPPPTTTTTTEDAPARFSRFAMRPRQPPTPALPSFCEALRRSARRKPSTPVLSACVSISKKRTTAARRQRCATALCAAQTTTPKAEAEAEAEPEPEPDLVHVRAGERWITLRCRSKESLSEFTERCDEAVAAELCRQDEAKKNAARVRYL